MEYYIAHNEKVLGPCTLQELRTFIYYGSVKMSDFVMRVGEADWVAAGTIPELADFHTGHVLNEPHSLFERLLTEKPKPPRRILRYQDYVHVPPEQRALVAAWRLLTGFLLWPPRLWREAALVFSSNIYRRKKDAHGFHKIWPGWVEGVVSVMIVTQALAVCLALMWLTPRAVAVYHLVAEVLRGAADEVSK